MTTIVRCARALCGGTERSNFAFAIQGERIAAVDDADRLVQRYPRAHHRLHDGDCAVIPGFVNGHSHAYQVLLRGWADDLPFERWRGDALYKVVPQLSPDDVYDAFRFAFDEMLAAGITTAAEFFYLNGSGNSRAEAAIAAARDARIRLIFARTWMDAAGSPAAFRETIDEARRRTEMLMNAYPDTKICVAPHSLHAASPDMVRAAADFARSAGCDMHIHVAEAQYEGEQTLERFGATPVQLLQGLDALNERTVAVHAIYVSDEEKRMLASAGARVVHNPVTNQYLGDGICDVLALERLGVPIALGTDADVKPSILDEMRAAVYLQKIAARDGSALGAATAFALGTVQGAAAVGIDAGDFSEGSFADYCVVDTASIEPWVPLRNALVYRAETSWIRETYVSGERVRSRENTPEVPERLRALLPHLRLGGFQ